MAAARRRSAAAKPRVVPVVRRRPASHAFPLVEGDRFPVPQLAHLVRFDHVDAPDAPALAGAVRGNGVGAVQGVGGADQPADHLPRVGVLRAEKELRVRRFEKQVLRAVAVEAFHLLGSLPVGPGRELSAGDGVEFGDEPFDSGDVADFIEE